MAEVYLIEFPNGKGYVGISKKGAAQRFKDHCKGAERGPRTAVQAALRKYGAASVKLRILLVGSPAYCLDIEDSVITAYGTLFPTGYNLVRGGGKSGTIPGSPSALRQAAAARNISEETRHKRAEAARGRRHTPETIKKMSENAKKQFSDPAARAFLSDKLKNGPGLSKEALAKISVAHEGRIWINNGECSRFVRPEDAPAGWMRGRLKAHLSGIESHREKQRAARP